MRTVTEFFPPKSLYLHIFNFSLTHLKDTVSYFLQLRGFCPGW